MDLASSILSFHSNSDILDEICEYLAYDDDEAFFQDADDAKANRQALMHLALTCKAFLEPALDRLWRVLESLLPLLKVLSAFTRCDDIYVLRGSISEQEWARFDWYARRVRRFSYSRDPDLHKVAMHVYFRLAQLRSTPILPALRHLHCPSIRQRDFFVSGILCLFLSPSLQTLKLEDISPGEDKLCGTLLHTLFTDGARLEGVILQGEGLSRDSLTMVMNFEHLRELGLQGMGLWLDMDLLEQIGKMPWLVDLTIDFNNSLIPPLQTDIGLRDLKSLIITAPIPFILSFLPHIGTSVLETFVAATPTPSADKRDLLQYVASRWKDTLRRIELVHDQGPTEDINLAILSPLMPLKKLTHVRLDGYTMDLTNANVETFALAWPELTTLLLPFSGPGQLRPSIDVLGTLARLLPRLRHLSIPLNMGILPPFISTGVPHSPPHGLYSLTVASAEGPMELRDLLHLARHVDYFFPRLKHVVPPEAPQDPERWTQVQEMIKMYQAVRAEAVAFANGRERV